MFKVRPGRTLQSTQCPKALPSGSRNECRMRAAKKNKR